MKRRLISSNHTDASACLAEIRACGALLEAGYEVQPIPTKRTPTPEFAVSSDGHKFIVEVHAKQFNATTDLDLQQHNRFVAEQPSSPGVSVYTHAVHPFGRPENAGDTTTLNAISRICSIKGREHQLSAETTSILWFDFQDVYNWSMGLSVEQFLPLLSWNEHITSGALWHALYGWKGCPIVEQCHYSNLDLPYQMRPMAHEGRFLQSSKLSAVIISLPTATILAETFRQNRQLGPDIRMRYLGLPWAGIHHAIAEWSTGTVVRRLAADAGLVCGLFRQRVPDAYR